jgi:GGDEF domain-containing protein
MFADASLIIDREGAIERLGGREFLLALLRLLDQARQLGAKLCKERVDGSLAKTGVVAVEESIVRGQF